VANDAAQPALARASALARLDASASRASHCAGGRARTTNPLVRLGALQGLESAPPAPRADAALDALSDSQRAVRLEAVRVLAEVSRDLPPSHSAALTSPSESARRRVFGGSG
jgi:hypothetical protein